MIVKTMRPRRLEEAFPIRDQSSGLALEVSQYGDIEASFMFAGTVPEQSNEVLIHPGGLSKWNTQREGSAS
jgi:hypothetical protein